MSVCMLWMFGYFTERYFLLCRFAVILTTKIRWSVVTSVTEGIIHSVSDCRTSLTVNNYYCAHAHNIHTHTHTHTYMYVYTHTFTQTHVHVHLL